MNAQLNLRQKLQYFSHQFKSNQIYYYIILSLIYPIIYPHLNLSIIIFIFDIKWTPIIPDQIYILQYSMIKLLLLLTTVYVSYAVQLCKVASGSTCTTCQPYAELHSSTFYCYCPNGFYMNTQGTEQFCDRCHISCLTCSGSLSTDCITCRNQFTFNNVDSECLPPETDTDQMLVENVYNHFGFTQKSGWSKTSFSTSTYQCGIKTVFGGTVSSFSNDKLYFSLSSIPAHFQLRVMVGYYFFNANGTSKSATIDVDGTTQDVDGEDEAVTGHNCGSYSYVYRNIDVSIAHTAATATIKFYTNADVHYGIRQVYVIAKKCASNCSTCDGYLATQCLTCTDSTRLATFTSINNGTCLCKDDYYQQPFSGNCVDPCPSVPNKYYGDNDTRYCVRTCPDGSFAYDDLFRCWSDCPTTSVVDVGKKLFRDYTNKRCVTNCPSTEPYGYEDDRKCYETCPGSSYKSNTEDYRCVNVCPHPTTTGSTYVTYGHLGQCIAHCPDGFWADPSSSTCQADCTDASYTYKDDSTGDNMCVGSCPAPNRFADLATEVCVQTCPPNFYGQNTNVCVSKCGSPRWGLVSGNRKCVDNCPKDTWGQPSDRICVETTEQCNPLYANDYTRTCVAASSCPFGTFADNATYDCVQYCPNLTYGHPTSRYCQIQCDSPYFKDDGVHLCVTECITQNTYADVDSSRACVTACNTSGSTKWADDSTRQCVSDCNQTVSAYISDNTTWKCVYHCPNPYVADYTTVIPKCVSVCPPNYFADFTSGTGICVQKCSTNPSQFGDDDGGLNLCVDICAYGTYGDETGNRLCVPTCPDPYFSQNDAQRRCVLVCNESSYGWDNICEEDPHDCPAGYYGDQSTNLCVDPCPAIEVTFGDPESKLCVRECPDNPNTGPDTYYADISNRLCVLTCNASHSTPLFGNNDTRTCQPKCLDHNSYAQVQTTYRICVARCLQTPTLFYANNFTKVCGVSSSCPTEYYGQNDTQLCLQECPNTTYGFKDSNVRVCVTQCPSPTIGDTTTGKPVCVFICPTVPEMFADLVLRICVQTCPINFYGNSVDRTCVTLCPSGYFAHEPTRRCIQVCPLTFYGDDTASVRYCHPSSGDCTYGFGDDYTKKCESVCTGPSPVNTFGSGDDCVSFCPNGTYADSHTGTRLCVALCPPGVLTSTTSPNLYGDPTTHTCVSRCITPDTWSDYQTRLCEPVCSETPLPTYSQNIGMTCVSALNCPSSPMMMFGDNTTRTCTSFCSNEEWGDPTSRNCVNQCPNVSTTGTSRYFGDNSTGQYLCVVICPQVPQLYGQNNTNLCVDECPIPTYGDQTGNRSCVPQCPLLGSIYHYAQNFSRTCVLVCTNDTWGLQSSRQCVEDPFHCGSLWADNSTSLCVTICPSTAGTFGDPTTRICEPVCPDGLYADDLTRTCVTACPQNSGVHDTFANNDTNICEQVCQQEGAYADPQTGNRYCVLECSQSPEEAFADPFTKSCVPECPTHPDLYAQTQNFTCVTECIDPYYADTHTRRCETSCGGSEFKLNDPRKCVTQCPSDPQLFGDPSTGFCQEVCSSGFRYSITRLCVASCQTYSLLQYNGTCVKYCPYGFYANTSGNCLSQCPPTTFGQNTTTTCLGTCLTGYAEGSLCIAICPDGKYGQNKVCVSSCSGGTTASDISNLCVSTCDAGTYMQSSVCETSCSSGTYADPNTNLCSTSCTLGRYADSSTNTCVETCPVDSYRDPSFVCKTDCSPLRADNITGTCTSECSDGYWGYNNECIDICPDFYYGYDVDRDCYDIASRPDSSLFADNVTQTWVSVCPYEPLTFGDPLSKQCEAVCEDASYYADPVSRKCETACTNSSYFLDPTTKTCVLVCPEGYHSNPDNGVCQQNCTHTRYDYEPERRCVSSCPAPYYGYDNAAEKICVLGCPDGYFAQNDRCQTGCTLPLYADSSTNRCVPSCIDSYASDDLISCEASCPSGKIGDNSTNKCVSLCPTEPDYYEQSGFCVMHCSTGYADPTTGVRQCTILCTLGLFGDPLSGRCLSECLPGYYAFDGTRLCVQECPSGFADNITGKCVADCPAPTFADSLTNKCSKLCSNSQFGEGRVCVGMCTDPNYGNPLTQQCQTTCPQFDYLFAQNDTNMCVKDCSFIVNSYADRGVNVCVSNCTRSNQYMLDSEGICTSLCPEGLFMQNSTKKCQADCTTGYAEPTTRYCVAQCFGNPQTYAHIAQKTCIYKCLTSTLTLYADNSTYQCVSTCPASQLYFSDPISGNCVLFCPQGLYAQNDTRTCTSYCSVGFADNYTRKCVADCPVAEDTYADSTTRTCVKVCPDGMVAENDTQECVLNTACPSDTWSDQMSKHCVARCPSEPLYFGLNSITSCVKECPLIPQLYGDYVTQTCIANCTPVGGQLRFDDPISRTCVFVCPISENLYGDTLTGKCVSTCSNNQQRDNSTQRCVSTCPSNPDYYALESSFFCVRVCPDGLFASDSVARICTSDCGTYSTFGDPTTNRCTPDCPQPYFADDSTDMCVLECPDIPDYFADPHSRTCVANCPSGSDWVTYAEDINRTCVTRCPDNYYAQNTSKECVTQCPPNEYADLIIQVCVADCTVRPGQYKQTNDRICVQDCPTVTKAHKYDVTHTCVEMTGLVSGCPGSYYANPLNDMCTTRCPHKYFAQASTKMCVTGCAVGQFADSVDRACKTSCTTDPESYAYSGNNTCLKYCPDPLYSENATWTCTSDCPSSPNVYYAYDITRQCVLDCPQPYFSYLPDQECVLECPTPYFAQQSTRSCQTSCDSPFNADDSTNQCVMICPETPEYYAHNNVCVSSCPTPYFKDISTRTCVAECPAVPLLFADDSTNTCVENCPVSENYFADNTTRTCVTSCFTNATFATFADVSTRTCVLDCPTEELTYADPATGVCQPSCAVPYYRSNLTHQCVTLCPIIPFKTYAQDNGRVCVYVCEDGKFGDNYTRTCISDCLTAVEGYADTTTNMCVTTCPYGWFAYNDTMQCRRDCPGGLFADNSTRTCVIECPGTQELFADETTYECVSQCPSGYYGNRLTWTCIDSCPNDTSGYRLEVARLCVEQCPSPYFALVNSRVCVTNCGNGLFGDPVTRQCLDCPSTCPTCLAWDQCLTCDTNLYLSFGSCVTECILTDAVANYANNNTMHCVEATQCPSGTFGENTTKECSSSCPAQMYGNTTTQTCENCPSTCLGCTNSTHCTSCITAAEFAPSDQYCYPHCNSTHQYTVDDQCYSSCPSGTYVDYTNVNCEKCNVVCLTCDQNSLNCTSCDGTFKFNNTCVAECPDNYYALNEQCVECTPDVESCSTPLSFETYSAVQDYKQVVIIKFNQKANIRGSPKDFIKVKLKINRRLLDMSDLVNNGVGYTAQVLPDGTIKLYLEPGMSIEDANYQVIFTDGSHVTTEGGGTLQNLQGQIALTETDVYPQGTTSDAPLVPVAYALTIVLLVMVFFMLIFGLSPIYVTIESFQIFSLYAYTQNIAPNLFYFLKELRFSRFVFFPTIFNNIYVAPETYDARIPQKVIDTESLLSFAELATMFFYFIFFYIVYALIIYMFTTRFNSNRPLKNMFIKIYQTRVKFGVVSDFLWLFTLNVLTCSFMQFRYPDNVGDLVLAIISGVFFLALIFGFFGYGVRKYRTQPQVIQDNYSQFQQGTKDEGQHKFFVFAYLFRQIIFAAVIVGCVFETMIQVSVLCAMFSIYLIVVVALRPYKDNLRNFIHFAHEGGLIFINGGIIYFLQMEADNQPVGSKVVNGQIITIVLIIHLSIAIIWGLFRSYIHLKNIKDQFKKTQFYKLYLDDEYDESIEKQLSQLNQADGGEVQSVSIAQTDLGDEEEEMIKLKIKRKAKKNRPKVQEEMREETKDKKGQYIKLDTKNQKYYELKPHSRQALQGQYEKMIIQSQQPIQKGYNPVFEQKKQKDENEWVAMDKSEQKKQSEKDSEDNDFQQVNKNELQNIFQSQENQSQQNMQNPKEDQLQDPKQDELQDEVQDKVEEKQKEKEEKKPVQKMMKSHLSSFKDFDEGNFFAEEPQKQEKQKQQQKHQPQEQKKQQKNEDIYDVFDFDDILGDDDEKKEEQENKKQENQQKQQKKQEKKGFGLDVDDLLDEGKQDNQEEKKKKEEKKKMHLMLFDDEDFD